MKTIILMMMTVLFLYSSAIPATPPTAVQKTFEKKFPTATKIKWGKEGAKEWEAEFTFEGNSVSANFTEGGMWLETERAIKLTDLPKAVAVAIASKYSGWTIAEADKTETAKHGLIYEADLKKGKEKKDVAFKEDGTPVVE